MSPFDMYTLLYKSLPPSDRDLICHIIHAAGQDKTIAKNLCAVIRQTFKSAMPGNDGNLSDEEKLARCVEYAMVGLSLKHFTANELAARLNLTVNLINS